LGETTEKGLYVSYPQQIFTDGTGLAMKPPYGQVIKE
jgi:hypothetical protein